ncbi:MAG TPA: hypothetical protein VI504_01510 [Candidatus Eisenbacteria bacterium]|jgi:hypothetical protein
MPKSSRVLLAAALPLCLLVVAVLGPRSAGAARPAARSLLQNPDFERGMPTHPWMPSGWDTSTAELPTVFFGRDSFIVHGGKWAVNVANMSGAIPLAHNWSQTLLVGPETWGKVAVFKAWTRSNGVDGRAYLLVQAYADTVSRMAHIWNVDREEAFKRLGINKIDDPLLDLGWKRTQFDEPLTEWVQREARAYVPPGTNVLFVRCGLMGTGQVLFDDASLTFEKAPAAERPAKGENLFAEPGFEQRGLAWDVAIPPYEGAKVVVDSTVAHTGRCSIKLADFHDGLVEARIGVAQPFEGRRLRGLRVRLSAWFKGDSLRGSALVKIYAQGLRTHVLQSPAAELLSGTWDWKQVAIELDIPDDAELVWANCIAFAPAPGTVWIDDAKFEVVGPATSAPSPGRKTAAVNRR